MAKRLAIIDGKSVFYRGYYGMPNLSTAEGKPTGGVYGFAVLGLQILKKLNPDYVIVAWDKSKTNIRARRKLYPEYKANRKPMPDDMREQIPILRELLDGFGWPLLETDDYEADDIMGALALQAKKRGLETVLISSDLDLLQLVQPQIQYYALKKGLTDIREYTDESINEEFGFSKEKFDDYKALKGDSSDNIPGVAGVGEKTAKELVQKYATLENIYEHLDELKDNLRNKLEAGRDMAFLSRELVHIMTEAPVKLDLKASEVSKSNPAAIRKLFQQLEFKRLVSELPASMQATAEEISEAEPEISVKGIKVSEVTTAAELTKATVPSEIALYTIWHEHPDTKLPEVKELVLSPKPNVAYLVREPALVAQVPAALKNKTVIGFDLKSDLKAWEDFAPKAIFDVMVAAFLLNALLRQSTLQELAKRELKQNIPSFDQPQLLGVEADAAAQIASALWQLYTRYLAGLNKLTKVKKVALDIEWPIIPVLAKMERRGIALDSTILNTMSKDFEQKIKKVEQKIYNEAKDTFNISSPGQLQTVLFDKLALPKAMVKKTKTGYSTAASELEKLRELHPIIDMITEYRELTKLKSTYVDPLPNLVDKNHRLHTNFNITMAQTGRLSSENPNLMNIPVRTEAGRAIRNAFVAGKGSVLISADYSQFELRIAACLANDKNMIHAFNKGIDIHAMTAAELTDKEIGEVTPQERRAAKVVNFGVLYGMSPHGLSVATGMTREQAKEFIDRYFEVRQPLVKYLESLVEKAKKDGFVETLFGRRRPVPDIHSSNFVVRNAAERATMNMPIQGTAADLMKMAMIEIDKKLDKDSHMLLQIHDSILIESPKPKAPAAAKTAEKIMENIYKMPVKLEVDTKIGNHWGEL